MRFISWVTFVRTLWMNPWNICKLVCRSPSVETWPCTSQFLKLGPEILTRDLDQAHQNGTWRTKRKKNGWNMAGQKFSKIMKLMKSQRFFFSLLWVRQVLFWWAWSKSRVKISGPNSKKWTQHSDIGLFWASWPAQLVPDSCSMIRYRHRIKMPLFVYTWNVIGTSSVFHLIFLHLVDLMLWLCLCFFLLCFQFSSHLFFLLLRS